MPRLVPGLALTAGATALLLGLAPVLARSAPSLSPLVLALLVGAAVASVLGARGRADGSRGRQHVSRLAESAAPGTDWVARHVLRAGVVLLGLQLSLGDVLGLGWRGLAVVMLTVAVTFGTTVALGPRLGVPRDVTLLVATGFSICGAAAVSAMTGVLGRTPGRRDPAGADGGTPGDGAAVALALVALYGTAAVVVLPRLAGLLGLTAVQAGLWVGASVQEVAQVVAAAGGLAGATALATATVAKLARVVLLAPLVAGTGAVRARRAALTAPRSAGTEGTSRGRDGGSRPALVPGFVLGFLGAVMLRSLGIVPDAVLDVAAHVTTALFVAAMFALGTGVDVPRLVRTGGRALLLGACSAVVVTTTALGAVLLLTP